MSNFGSDQQVQVCNNRGKKYNEIMNSLAMELKEAN